MFTTVPSWIERLFGLDVESGEGTAWSIEQCWDLPAWVTVLFLAFAVLFVMTIYSREGRRVSRPYRFLLASLRLGAILLALLMIAQVTLSLKRTGLPYAAVIVDDSLSMTTVDHYGEKQRKEMLRRLGRVRSGDTTLSRWNLAQILLSEQDGDMLREIADGHKLRLYYLTGTRPSKERSIADMLKEIQSLSPTGERSCLGDSIRTVLDDLRGAAPSGIVLLTDGVNTEGVSIADGAEYARRRGVPLFFIGLGNTEPSCDLKLSDLLVDDVVFVDDMAYFECKLSATGFQGKKTTITLREKDKPAVLAKIDVTMRADGESQPIRIPFRPTKVGQFDYVVEAQPLDGESQTDNNRLSRIVQVRKEKIRVLLVQAYPNFEYRYLRNMLQRDETISLHTFLQEADLEHAEQDASALRTFPLRREDLFAYDVIIFGDVNPALLNAAALQNLADFVDQPAKGGSLVLIAGPSFMPSAYRETPLAGLFPFALDGVRRPAKDRAWTEGFVVQPTDLGLASPSMQLGDTLEQTQEVWRSLAPLYWLFETPKLKPGVRVLAEHPTRSGPDGCRWPVFCLQYVGAGKVLFHATDETWRWRYRGGDEYFARYWVQTIRYLCRAKLTDAGRPVLLSADRREYAHGEPVRLRVRFADERLAPAEDDGVTVVVELSGHQTQRLVLRRTAVGRGVFEGNLARPAPGDYHAWIAAPTLAGQSPAADFTVTPPAGEFTEIRMDAAEMQRAAQETGGRFYTFDTAERVLHDFPPGRQVPIESLPPLPLWNKWPVLALFLALLVAEWILRKRGGMV